MLKQINKLQGYENVKDYYFITTCGKVISNRNDKAKVLKVGINRCGYPIVHLKGLNGKNYNKSVHRLVALAYIPNAENKPQVNHIDEIKTHNYVGNLEWMTAKENTNYGTRNERGAVKRMGVLNHMYGKIHSEETKRKIGLSSLGRKHTDMAKEKCRLANLGKIMSEDTKKKISEKLKNNKNHLGKKHSYETRKKLSKSVQYWETTSTTRSHFKRWCKNLGFKFEQFEEIFAEVMVKPSGNTEKKYFYKLKEVIDVK